MHDALHTTSSLCLLLICTVGSQQAIAQVEANSIGVSSVSRTNSFDELDPNETHVTLARVEAGKEKVFAIEQFVYFNQKLASSELRKLTVWIKNSGDNQGFPYLIIDKANAQLLIFNSKGDLMGTTPVLLGMAHGDYSVKGISHRKLHNILRSERITPAGRYILEFGHDLRGQDIFWVDYDAAISIHRLLSSSPKEHRKERLQSTTHLDNRISYGCINVEKEFYENTIRKVFQYTAGFAYIMPEEAPLELPFK